MKNSAVAAIVSSIVTSWPQAQPYVEKITVARDGTETRERIANHPAAALIASPSATGEYTSVDLMQSALRDRLGSGRGSAFVFIVLTAGGMPAELQYLPAHTIEPIKGSDNRLSHFEYTVPGTSRKLRIDKERLIHWRNGINPDNPLEGIDPLESLDIEVACDNEARLWQFGLLNRGGVPTWLLTPKGSDEGAPFLLDKEDADTAKADVNAIANGEDRGGGGVLTAPMDFHKLGIDPQRMNMAENSTKSEERISGVLNFPAVVAGLGAGLKNSTFNNYQQARAQAWEDSIIPLQDSFGAAAGAKLLQFYPDLQPGQGVRYEIAWDRSNVPCLREMVAAKGEYYGKLYTNGGIDRAEYRRGLGFSADTSDVGVYCVAGGPGYADPAAPAPSGAGAKLAPTIGGVLPLAGSLKVGSGTVAAPSLSGTLAAIRRGVMAREASAVKVVSDAYDVAQAAIDKRIGALISKAEEKLAEGASPDVVQGWLDAAAEYQDLAKEIDLRLSELGAAAAPAVEQGQADSASAGVSESLSTAAAMLGDGPAGVAIPWKNPPLAAIEALAGHASDGSPLADLFDEIRTGGPGGESMRKQITDALIAGIATGNGPKEIAAAMRQGAGAKLALGKARAETIARTELMRAYNEASRASFEQNSDVVKGAIWHATRDSRTCRSCWAMHGTKLAPGETVDDHPNGRCIALPETYSYAEILGDSSIEDKRPQVKTGAELFDLLPEARQREVLGTGLYDLFKSGDIVLADCTVQDTSERWGTSRRAATIEEAKANAEARKAKGNG